MIENFGLEYHLVDSCNLKCAACSHYSSLLDRLSYVSLDRIGEEMELLYEKTDNGSKLKWLRLLGGEPLLHPDISHCISLIRNHFKDTKITLVTNGILIKHMNAEFYKISASSGCKIQITDYGVIDMADSMDLMNSYGIECECYHTIRQWFYQNIRTSGEIVDCFNSCYHRILCPNYRNKRIYLCPQMAYIDIFNNHFSKSIPIVRGDYVDVESVMDFTELITEYNKLHPTFCKSYCNCTNPDGNPPLSGKWTRTRKKIHEFCKI